MKIFEITSPAAEFVKALKTASNIPHVSTDAVAVGDAEVRIEGLEVAQEHRGTGLGKRIMQVVISLADHYGVTLSLQPNSPQGMWPNYDNALNQDDLTDWYRRLGFEYNDNGFMFRQPDRE